MKLFNGTSLSADLSIFSSYEVFAELLLLLFADLLFIIGNYLLYHTHVITNDSFSLFKEFGYPEMFQYWKEISLAVVFLKVFKKTKDHIFIVWSLFFSYLLLDDSIKIHERIGEAIANHYIIGSSYIGALRGQDFGELIVSGIVGSLFIILFTKYFYKSNQVVRMINFNLVTLVILLLFFGVFIDFAHMVIPEIKGMQTFEDGGEMIAMSLLLWYTYNLFKFYPETTISILPTPMLTFLNSLTNIFQALFTRAQKKFNVSP